MTDKEKIRAEISYRLKKEEELYINYPSSLVAGLIQAYNNVIKYIDTLPEEHVSEQLEEEYRNYLKQARMEHKISRSETVAAIYFALYEKNKFVKGACEWFSNRFNEKGCLDPNDITDFKKYMED